MRCEQCGEELLEGAHFCGECGARVAQAPPPNAVADTEFARGEASLTNARGAQGHTDTVAAAEASRGPKTAPMTEAPELPSPGVAKTDPMAGVPLPQYSPAGPAGSPATTLPWQEPKRKSHRGLIAALLLLALATLGGLLFVASGRLPLKWPPSQSEPAALPPLVAAPPAPVVEAPERIEPLVPDPVPLPPPSAPVRPPASPPNRPPAAPATPPVAPPTLPTPPPSFPALPPGVTPPVPPATPPTTAPAPSPNPPAPAPGLPTIPGIQLPWGNATSGACERCIAELRNGGHYAVPLAAAQHLLCEDPAARERCAAEIREASPALAERAARNGDCAAAWATKTAALNLGVGNDRFQAVDALCR